MIEMLALIRNEEISGRAFLDRLKDSGDVDSLQGFGHRIYENFDPRARVLKPMYRELIESAPPELTCVLGLRFAPPAPWIDQSAHGQPIVLLLACHTGDVAEGESLVAPIKSFGSPAGDVIMPRGTYVHGRVVGDILS